MVKTTVTELMMMLNKMPPNMEIWIASDGECSYMKPIFEVTILQPDEAVAIKEYEPEQYEDMPDEGVVLLIPV